MREVERWRGHRTRGGTERHRGGHTTEIGMCKSIRGRNALGGIKLEELVEQIKRLRGCFWQNLVEWHPRIVGELLRLNLGLD